MFLHLKTGFAPSSITSQKEISSGDLANLDPLTPGTECIISVLVTLPKTFERNVSESHWNPPKSYIPSTFLGVNHN